MAINFPNSPSPNQQYTYDNKTWEWNGTYWEVYSALTSYITSAYTVGNGVSDISGVTGGNIVLKSFSGVNITIVDGGDKLTFSGYPQQNVVGFYLPLSGGTVTGGTIFQSGLTANTVSATTITATNYQNLPFSGTITGNGTINYIPKWTGTTGLGDSQIYDNGTNVGIGTSSPLAKLDVQLTGGTVGVRISGDSSSDMLRVTQTGAGNAIIVEDDTNPDSTPFVVAADGRVGIGITSPLSTYRLHVRNGQATNSSAAAGTVIAVESSGTTYISLLSPDGSTNGITYGSNTDRFGAYTTWNYGNNDFRISTAKTGGFIRFQTDEQVEQMRIDATGNVGIGTTSPSQKLHVSGNTIISSGLTASTVSATTYYNLPVSAVTSGTDISASTSSGNVTITNTAPDQIVTISGDTGIVTGGTYPNFTITNSAPDLTVTITGGTNIEITGTYPDFGVNYTGTSQNLIASNSCNIPPDNRVYVGNSNYGWGYGLWDLEYPSLSEQYSNVSIPINKTILSGESIDVCGKAYVNDSNGDTCTLHFYLYTHNCDITTITELSRRSDLFDKDGLFCFSYRVPIESDLSECDNFLVLGFRATTNDATVCKITYTINSKHSI